VVGVVPDTRYRELREARATVYFPLAQSFFPYAPTTLAIRTTGSPANLVSVVRRIVSARPGIALANASPFNTYLAGPLAQPRLNAFLLALFGAAALVLAAIGVFGIMTTMVQQRTRELGIRMALGATAGIVVGIVMRRAFGIAVVGVVTGVAGALAANRLLASLLYETSPTDAAALATAGALLIGVAAVATFIPARTSARIDPAIALRADI
jgi:ABC-type antimicrobial peptide transport system permease subunit